MSDILNDIFPHSRNTASEKVESFYKVKNKSKKELHEWLTKVIRALQEQSEPRTRTQRENLLMYRGISLRRREIERDRAYRGRRIERLNKFVIPHIHDLTETRVSQMMRIKPTVEVLPANNEWEDRASAKVVQLIIKHLWDENNIDHCFQELHRYARVYGEVYLWIDWDENKGDLHPLYVTARDLGVKEVEMDDGTKIKVSENKPIKTGDVCYTLESPWRVFLQRKPRFKDVEYVFRAKLVPTDVLRDKYGKTKVKETADLEVFDIEIGEHDLLEDHTLVFEFHHKETAEVPNGFKAIFTLDELLESGDVETNYKGFPFIRLTDMDVPNQLDGVSKYQMVSPLINMYNNLNTVIAKNIWLTAHAKWMMPRGAAKLEQLGNDNTVVQYQGAVPPKLVQVQPNPPEVYRYASDILRQTQTIYGSHGISRGEIPKGITATSALTFLNELESERATTDIAKHSQAVRDLAKLTIAIIGDKYDIDDGRLVRIVGDQNQFLLRHFDTAHLHKSYDVKFDLGAGLPDTKAGKRQVILDMMQRNPAGYEMERWEELLEVGNTEKAVDLMTAAVRAADSENEDFSAGRPVQPPEEWEDHITHWQSHARYIQSRQIKEEMPPERRAALKDHIFWTEEAIIDKMSRSPQYEARVAGLAMFPLFHHNNYAPARGREHQEAVVQGAANKLGIAPGDAMIPTDDLSEPER